MDSNVNLLPSQFGSFNSFNGSINPALLPTFDNRPSSSPPPPFLLYPFLLPILDHHLLLHAEIFTFKYSDRTTRGTREAILGT